MTGFKSKRQAALDEEGMYLVHQTDHSENNLVHEAMLAYWGERCPDHHKECVCCQAWEHYDGKTSTQPAQERNFCPRCGKRTADLTVIHTCTPPQKSN
jgi:anti-sigma factor ChrR (cupin superfamily)